MFLLVDEYDVGCSLLDYLVPEQAQNIALADTALPSQDDDGIFT